MAEEICEEDIRKAFESGRLRFRRCADMYKSTCWSRSGTVVDPTIQVEIYSIDGPTKTLFFAAIRGEDEFGMRITRFQISRELFSAVQCKVLAAEPIMYKRFRERVKRLLNS